MVGIRRPPRAPESGGQQVDQICILLIDTRVLTAMPIYYQRNMMQFAELLYICISVGLYY